MFYKSIKMHDIANGPGVRVSLFVSGCTHHCKGCFNPETWSFDAGAVFDAEVINRIVGQLKNSFCSGLTLLGGEPFEPDNQRGVLPLIRQAQREVDSLSIWGYTGYVLDRDLIPGGRACCEVTEELLASLDVLVDGPFVEEKKDVSLIFRGSSNQRLIDMKASRRTGSIVLCDENRFRN